MSKPIKWKVQPVPVGRYRSFEKRGWPEANWPDGRPAVTLACDDDYSLRAVRLQAHGPITVRLADYSAPGNGFKWRTLIVKADSLDRAKALAERALARHAFMHPKM